MEFRKKIDVPPSEFNINHQSKLMLFGSCFVQNIGKLLLENKFLIDINPFGILYNPMSIHQSIEILLQEKDFSGEDVFEYQGLFHTFFHHSEFSNADKDSFIKDINTQRKAATGKLKSADVLLITFGTSYVFKYKENDQIVANCHKLKPSYFENIRLSVEDIVDSWSKLIETLQNLKPNLKIVFTVSPIRHWKDGAHNNQLSKSTLLLAIDMLIGKYYNMFYFPSYEIVLDELRDYRFYSEDMIHPNKLAINYIWEVFSKTFFNNETMQINEQWQSIKKAMDHKPFNPHTTQHKEFLRQTLLKIKYLQDKYTFFDCTIEERLITDQLSLLG